MKEIVHSCELWAEPISLMAAGCLSPDDERDVRLHIETCSDCRERFRQLGELCGTLAAARLPADDEEAAAVERILLAVASDESRGPADRPPAKAVPPSLLAPSAGNWNWIIRSPLSPVLAVAVFFLAITAAALWFHGGGARYAFADFIAPILEAKNAKFKITGETKGSRAIIMTVDVMVLDGTRWRQEIVQTAMPDRPKSTKTNKSKVTISDWGRGKVLTLDLTTKSATVFTFANMTKEQASQHDMFALFRSVLLDAWDKSGVKREPLGETDIDGRRVVGFRISTEDTVMSLWGDPRTGLPVLAEATVANVKVTISDFVFNVDMDRSLFSVEPPAGYTVQDVKIDASPMQERDLIETLREGSTLNGGVFLDSLGINRILPVLLKKFAPKKGEQPNEEQTLKMVETQMRLRRGSLFAFMLPTDADAHYAGKGVSLGAADRPIFWYRPRGAKKYRVIYADLSIRESDVPPSVPGARPLTDMSVVPDDSNTFGCIWAAHSGPMPQLASIAPAEPAASFGQEAGKEVSFSSCS
jgi:hypothetical protein